jgi:carotenoid 1,2-hydratase
VGSVFSPYYRWARRGGRVAPAEDHCALNVALYGADAGRWTMTERSARHVHRDARQFIVGPSRVRWGGGQFVVEIDEVSVPLPRRVRGRVVVTPQALCTFTTPLDADGRHRWGPIAPCARVSVELEQPSLRFEGHAYLDSNEGDEPIDGPFVEWDWSRATLADGSTAVIYDVRPKAGADRVIAERFFPDGRVEPFEPPPRVPVPRTGWRIARSTRSDTAGAVIERRRLEDTPFYARSMLEGGLLGERVVSVHETLHVPRLVSLPVQGMLPFRMPRVS